MLLCDLDEALSFFLSLLPSKEQLHTKLFPSQGAVVWGAQRQSLAVSL